MLFSKFLRSARMGCFGRSIYLPAGRITMIFFFFFFFKYKSLTEYFPPFLYCIVEISWNIEDVISHSRGHSGIGCVT